MSALTKEIEDTLFSLPLDERARLADRLLISLAPEQNAQWFNKLDSEVGSRIEARKRGEIQLKDGNTVVANLWESLK